MGINCLLYKLIPIEHCLTDLEIKMKHHQDINYTKQTYTHTHTPTHTRTFTHTISSFSMAF